MKQQRFTKILSNRPRPLKLLKRHIRELLSRRPHRSFRLTRRRDYTRSLQLPGYWAFTVQAAQTVWHLKRLVFGAVALYVTITVIMVGLTPQGAYLSLNDAFSSPDSQSDGGWLSRVAQAGVLLAVSVNDSMQIDTSSSAQLITGFLAVMLWLVMVWVLRSNLANRQVVLRDAIYNAGAPIVSTGLVILVITLQILPAAIGGIIYSAASSSGVLSGGVEAMLIWSVIVLLIVLSLYWFLGAVMALVVVTLPGMYPIQAIRTAGDMVVGRRSRIFLRLVWLVLTSVLPWLLIIPLVMLDSWLKGTWAIMDWLPIVPIAVLVLSGLNIVWVSTYIYLLYRKIVEDEASPA